MIIGTIDNGRTGQADFPFYKGRVGIRDTAEGVELGYFGTIPTGKFPIAGTLDGIPVKAASYIARDASGVGLTLGAANVLRAVTLVVAVDVLNEGN